MILESKLKQAALTVALDISLRRMKKSPERCARNLVELGLTAYPDEFSKKDRLDIYQKLLDLCKEDNTEEVRALFFNTFHEKQN